MTVTYQPAGAYATGTASCTPSYPAVSAGDVLVMGCTFGNGNDTPLDTPDGFIFIPGSLEFGGDGGAYGTDSGNRGVMAFVRIADGTETGTVTVNNPGSGTTTRVTQAQIMRATKTGDAFNVRASNGEDNTDAVGYSVTADDVLIPANGDLGLAVTGWNPDSATAGTPTLTWDGVADTCTQAQSIASAQGADCRLVIYRRNLAGTGGSAPIFATTASAAVTGATAFILIHDGPQVTGQATATFGFTATAAGVDRALGAAVASLGFTATASGEVSAGATQGQATAAFGFTATASGIPRTSGQAAVDFGFTATASGVPETFGVALASFGFTATANGVDRSLGVAVAAFGFTATAAGTPRVQGAAVAAFGFTATASGVTGSPPVQGQATADFGFTASAAGIDRALGVAVASFGFDATASGVDRSLGVAVAAFGFTSTANGIVGVLGQALAALGFTATASGLTIVPTPTPPERISVAPADARLSVATYESRTSLAPADPRVSVADAAPRISVAPAPARTSASA